MTIVLDDTHYAPFQYERIHTINAYDDSNRSVVCDMCMQTYTISTIKLGDRTAAFHCVRIQYVWIYCIPI